MTGLIAIPDEETQPVDWRTIAKGLFDWADDELGLDDRVIWGNQNIPQPKYPYVSLIRGTVLNSGGIPETRVSTDLGAGPVEESTLITYMPITFVLSVSCHVDPDNGGNLPECDAVFLASKLQHSLGRVLITDLLAASGLSVIRTEAVVNTSVVINGVWTSRATLDVTFATASVMTENVGVIEQVEVTPEPPGLPVTVGDITPP